MEVCMAATGLVPAVLLAPPRDPWIRKQRPLAPYLDDLSAKDIISMQKAELIAVIRTKPS